MSPNVRFEQAVYGSFPFRGEGYAPLAWSAGCRPEWLDAFHSACRSIGEKPRGSGELAGMMFSMRTGRRGAWMMVGVSSPGPDDRGRPDALAFHGLFVERGEFRKVGFDPFALVGALRDDWGPGSTLAAGSISAPDATEARTGPAAPAIAAVLATGRKVALASDSPIVGLAREVWHLLPARDRERCSVATWAFASGPGFDLVAGPSLAGWELDASYADPLAGAPSPPRRRSVRPWLIASGVAIVAALVATRLCVPRREAAPFAPASAEDRPRGDGARFDWALHPALRPKDRTPGPDIADYSGPAPGPLDGPEVRPPLESFHAMFRDVATSALDPFTGGEPADPSPNDRDLKTNVMRQIHSWRYTGPLLTDAELAAIAKSATEGRSRALAWDRHIRRFVADRPLPSNFAKGPLRWRIDTLAWSFHVEPDPTLTPAEAVDAIADALKLAEPIAANPLEATFPTLVEYAKFLRRLPVR